MYIHEYVYIFVLYTFCILCTDEDCCEDWFQMLQWRPTSDIICCCHCFNSPWNKTSSPQYLSCIFFSARFNNLCSVSWLILKFLFVLPGWSGLLWAGASQGATLWVQALLLLLSMLKVLSIICWPSWLLQQVECFFFSPLHSLMDRNLTAMYWILFFRISLFSSLMVWLLGRCWSLFRL